MNVEKSCGAILCKIEQGVFSTLLVKHNKGGHWSFPKGHMEAGESEEETALREVKEETGLDILLIPPFRHSIFYFPSSDVKKEVVFFLARPLSHALLKQEEEIAEVRWVSFSSALSLLTYEQDSLLLIRAREAFLLP